MLDFWIYHLCLSQSSHAFHSFVLLSCTVRDFCRDWPSRLMNNSLAVNILLFRLNICLIFIYAIFNLWAFLTFFFPTDALSFQICWILILLISVFSPCSINSLFLGISSSIDGISGLSFMTLTGFSQIFSGFLVVYSSLNLKIPVYCSMGLGSAYCTSPLTTAAEGQRELTHRWANRFVFLFPPGDK